MKNLTALVLLLGLWTTPLALAEDPPAEGTPTEEAAPAAKEDGEKAVPATEEGEAKEGEAKEGEEGADLPEEVPVPEDIGEAIEQGGGILDALMAKQWWLAGILVLGVVLFVVNKYVLGSKKTEEKPK